MEKTKAAAGAGETEKLSRQKAIAAAVDQAMKKMDANGDNAISKKEAQAASKTDAKDEATDAKDQSKDAKTPPKKEAAISFKKADQNKDGKVDREELHKAMEDDGHAKLFSKPEPITPCSEPIPSNEPATSRNTFGIRFKF